MTRKKTQNKLHPGKFTLLALIFSAIGSIPILFGIMTLLVGTLAFDSQDIPMIFFIPFAASVVAIPAGIANIIYGIKNYKQLSNQYKIAIAFVGLFTLLVAFWWFSIIYSLFVMPTIMTAQ